MVAKLIALVLPLGLDTFAVAAAVGMVGVSGRQRLRVSALFVGFEAGMPLVGLARGAPLGHAVGGAADYIAIAVLLGFGLSTLLCSEEGEQDRVGRLAQVRGPGALLLGVSEALREGAERVAGVAVIALAIVLLIEKLVS